MTTATHHFNQLHEEYDQDAVSSVLEFPRGQASSPDAAGASPGSVPSEVCQGPQKLASKGKQDYFHTASHPTLNTTSLCETDPCGRFNHGEGAKFHHFSRTSVFVTSTRPSCEPPGGCISSAPVNMTHHRPYGESPTALSGSQDIEGIRLFGGLHHIKYKSTLRNRYHDFTTPALDASTLIEQPTRLNGFWPSVARIRPNNLHFKSLSNWSFNTAVGCSHGCRFCYVPRLLAKEITPQLNEIGVKDPDAQWGHYVYLRKWDEKMFLRSLYAAEGTSWNDLNPAGNRAVIYCSSTDPYQVIRYPDSCYGSQLEAHSRQLVQKSLKLIRDKSTLNVRILTRSPKASFDFDLFRSFGHRLVFGMSLPTLSDDLAKIYEPAAPPPSERLKTLQQAKEAGLHVYVAMSPTYPECDENDLAATLSAVRELDPITVFHEPINMMPENVQRIEEYARSIGVTINTDVFKSWKPWADFAVKSHYAVQRMAEDFGMSNHLHLWPAPALGAKLVIDRFDDPETYQNWLNHWWSRISEWPTEK